MLDMGTWVASNLKEKFMRHVAWCVSAMAVVVSALVVGTAIADDTQELKSGLQVGEIAPPFDVYDVTGPSAGTTLCYR